MKLSIDRALRIIWLLIGGLLLLFLLAGGVMILAQLIGNWGAGDDAVRIASQSQPPREEPRAVRYTAPHAIRGTSTRLVMVENGRAYEPGGGGYASGGRYSSAIVANAVFLDAQGARLLLDRPAYVRSIDFPRSEGDIQRWIEYRIAFEDGNRDGKLDSRDGTSLYVTDLEGRNLRQVLRPPLRLQGTEVMDATHMLVYALEPPADQRVNEDRMRQRAFIYDVPTGRLSPYAALDSAAARAGQILGR
jgi:hypothetical protein